MEQAPAAPKHGHVPKSQRIRAKKRKGKKTTQFAPPFYEIARLSLKVKF
jgi:hypothetical protein